MLVRLRIRRVLNKIPKNKPIGLTSISNNNLAFEVYSLACAIRAVGKKYDVHAKNSSGNNLISGAKFSFRTTQGPYICQPGGPCYFLLSSKPVNNETYEVHNRLQVFGHSKASHELDVAFVEPISRHQPPPWRRFRWDLRLSIECKNYGKGSYISTGIFREVLGLWTEVGTHDTVLVTKAPLAQILPGAKRMSLRYKIPIEHSFAISSNKSLFSRYMQSVL